MARIGFLLLSGGRSKRMGSHKALLEIDGRTLLETVALAGDGFEERILSVNDPAIPTPKGYVRCEDIYPGCGPMAGIHAALAMTDCDALVVAPCDAPHYCKELAQFLADQYEPELDALVLLDGEGRAQPLSGVYSRSCLPVLEAHLKNDKLKIMRMLEDMRLKKIALPDYLNGRVFDNLNTPDDLQAYKHK
ncbi:MAG: molybdenum cofactor guanylyltransferase [Clostridiales bacterium]|nr:molybdenum cofactor guanylyltransferase [Clostridiales bacterium]